MKSPRRPWSEVTAIKYTLIVSLIAVFITATVQTLGIHAGAAFLKRCVMPCHSVSRLKTRSRDGGATGSCQASRSASFASASLRGKLCIE
jgi:Flp pilus assembly pilin Flp